MKVKFNHGFTSIELMVVTAIVVIITMVGVPKYQAYKARTTVKEATSTLSSMWTAQHAFFMANDRFSTAGDPMVDASWWTTFLSNNELGIIVPSNAKYWYGGWNTANPAYLGFANLKNFWTTKLASCSTNFGDQRAVMVDYKTNIGGNWIIDGLAGC
jgi:prepilin-type N-terminal cleavage/methylation domain-containing protein